MLRSRVLATALLCTPKLFRFLSTSTNDVLLTETGSCGIITLNRPKVLNSLDLSMIRKIYPRLKEWNESPSKSHVILDATGNRAFCAGGDVRAVVVAAKSGDRLAQDFFREEYRLNHLIGTLKKPVVAVLDGITMGGGVGLSVHGKFRVATENTLFSMPETALGLFPDVGGGYFLPRLPIPGLGAFLALSGQRLKGKDVLWCGVATHFIPSDKLEELKKMLCDLTFSNVRSAEELKKVTPCISEILSMASTAADPPTSLAPHLDGIAKIFALFESNAPVTIDSILKKLEAYGHTSPQNGEWSKQIADILLKASPTSLKVTLRQLQKGSKCTFSENFKMEFCLSQHFVRNHDFPEGVRAILIDKDNQPTWKPNKLADVTPDLVENYFTMIPGIPEWHP